MVKNEDSIKESKKKLDSLIIEINEKAASITAETFPDPEKIVYVKEGLKRSKEEIHYPNNESAFLITEIWLQYWFAAFTNNPHIIQSIKERLKLTETEDWFLNIDDILFEFHKINETEKFRIDIYSSMVKIYNYVGTKIFALLYLKYVGLKNGEPLSVDRIRNHIDTKNNAKRKGKIPIQNDETVKSEFVLKLFGEIFNDSHSRNDNFKNLQSFLKGSCEAMFLPQIYNDYLIGHGKYNEGEKQLVIYDLFRLIIKDKFLKDEDTYSTTNATFSSYNAYKKDVVKKILKLK